MHLLFRNRLSAQLSPGHRLRRRGARGGGCGLRGIGDQPAEDRVEKVEGDGDLRPTNNGERCCASSRRARGPARFGVRGKRCRRGGGRRPPPAQSRRVWRELNKVKGVSSQSIRDRVGQMHPARKHCTPAGSHGACQRVHEAHGCGDARGVGKLVALRRCGRSSQVERRVARCTARRRPAWAGPGFSHDRGAK